MNVDLYCQHCSHVIEIICTNLDIYQHSVHKSDYDDLACDKCKSTAHVVIRCYIPRNTIPDQMRASSMERQNQNQENYEDTMLDLSLFEVTIKQRAV